MLKGYQGIIIVVAGLIATPLQAQQAGDASSNKARVQKDIRDNAPIPKRISPAIGVSAELAKRRNDQTDLYAIERNERERRDLIAQEDSAYWAKSNFWAMVAQTLVAAFALGFLLLDLRQSRKSAEQQLRAYVVVDDVEIFAHRTKPGHLYVAAHFKNVGETPATEVSAKIYGRVLHGVHFCCDMSEGATTGGASSLVLSKDSKRSVITHAVELYHGNTGAEIMSGDYSAFAYGFVRYRDVFGKQRETTFCFVTNPASRETPVTVVAAQEGNRCA